MRPWKVCLACSTYAQVAHALPRKESRPSKIRLDLILSQAKLRVELVPHILLTREGELQVDAVQRHPVELLLPPRPVPPLQTHTRTHTHAHTRTHTRTHTHAREQTLCRFSAPHASSQHTHARTCTHTHAHTRAQTHTQTADTSCSPTLHALGTHCHGVADGADVHVVPEADLADLANQLWHGGQRQGHINVSACAVDACDEAANGE